MTTFFKCPRFERCNANLCPLDIKSSERTMDRDEQICHYLCEVSKDGDPSLYENREDAWIYMIAKSRLTEMINKSVALRRRIQRASKTPSKLLKDQLELDL
jgi:hypothetical protein